MKCPKCGFEAKPTYFDIKEYKKNVSQIAEWLGATWEMAVQTAEKNTPPAPPDDITANEVRRVEIHCLAQLFFHRLISGGIPL